MAANNTEAKGKKKAAAAAVQSPPAAAADEEKCGRDDVWLTMGNGPLVRLLAYFQQLHAGPKQTAWGKVVADVEANTLLSLSQRALSRFFSVNKLALSGVEEVQDQKELQDLIRLVLTGSTPRLPLRDVPSYWTALDQRLNGNPLVELVGLLAAYFDPSKTEPSMQQAVDHAVAYVNRARAPRAFAATQRASSAVCGKRTRRESFSAADADGEPEGTADGEAGEGHEEGADDHENSAPKTRAKPSTKPKPNAQYKKAKKNPPPASHAALDPSQFAAPAAVAGDANSTGSKGKGGSATAARRVVPSPPPSSVSSSSPAAAAGPPPSSSSSSSSSSSYANLSAEEEANHRLRFEEWLTQQTTPATAHRPDPNSLAALTTPATSLLPALYEPEE